MDLIVMDCEGFGGMDESQNHDTRIFLFALLLSSYFVYNSLGSIDETALQTLSLVVNLAKDIRMRANDSDVPSEEEIAENFPAFLWIVRDFTLRLVDQGGDSITSKQYLEAALKDVKGNTDSSENKNRVRKLLKYFFRDRDCVTMVRPVSKEEELQKLDSLPDSFLKEEFLAQAMSVRTKIMKKTKPKVINGKTVTSEMLLHLANGYANSVNRGKVPTIESAWNYVCKQKADEIAKECLMGVDHLASKDEGIMNMIVEDKDWKGEIKSRLIARFTQSKFEDSKDIKQRQAELEKEIDEKLEHISKNLLHKQSQAGERWLEDQFEVINDLIKQDKINCPQKANELMDQLESKFHHENKHIPLKQREKLVRQFRHEKNNKILQAIIKTKQEEQRKEAESQSCKIHTLEKETAEYKSKVEEEKTRLNEKIKELDESNMVSRAQEAALKEKLTLLQDKIDFERQKAADREATHKGAFEELKKKYDHDMDSLTTRLTSKETDMIRLTSEKEMVDMMLKQQKELGTEAIENFKRRIHDLESQLEASRAREEALNLKMKDLHKSEEVKELKDQLETMKSKRRIVENEHSELKMEKQYLENQLKFYKEQIEDNKKLQDTLLGALQQQLKVEDDSTASELLATNKNLGISLGKAEARIKALETKLGRYKLYKQMISGCKALQCKQTGKLVAKNDFLGHLQNLEKVSRPGDRESDDSVSRVPDKIVVITNTMVKECPDTKKSYTEYLMQVKFGKALWKITRTYKELCELNSQLSQAYPSVKLPSVAGQIIGFGGNVSSLMPSKKKPMFEERRQALEDYLNDLFLIAQIASSPILREFLKIDIYLDDAAINRSELPAKSPLGDRNNSTSDIQSAYKHTSYRDVDSAHKFGSTTTNEHRRDRTQKENFALISHK